MEDKILTVEELIAIAKQNSIDKNVEPRELSEVERFVIQLDLKPGNTRVKPADLYEMYTSWSKKPVSNIEFGRQTSKFFTKKKVGGKVYVMLDKMPKYERQG